MKLRHIPIALLHERLTYNAETGEIHRIANKNGACKSVVAGTITNTGYRQISIDGVYLLGHRIAWAMSHGEWPEADIDHINGNRIDNRIVNLRKATRSQNLQNQHRVRSDNKAGLPGVFWNAKHNKWQSNITHMGKTKYLGLFGDKHEAHSAYLSAKKVMHPFSEIAK